MEKLLTSHQIAKLLNVWPETLRRWEKEGKLIPLRTPGGHRRYKESQIMALIGETKGEIDDIIIEYKDRLACFGYKYLQAGGGCR